MKWGDDKVKFSDLVNFLGELVSGKRSAPIAIILGAVGLIALIAILVAVIK